MNEALFAEAALPDSYLYQVFNRSAQFTTKVLAAIKQGQILTRSHIEEQILQIEKTRISILTDNVLQAFDDGSLVLLYSPKQKMPSALPFTVSKTSQGLRAFIFVANFGTLSKNPNGDEYYNGTMKDLYSLMEAAYIAIEYAKNPTRITKKLGLMKTSTEIYTMMVLRLLNKEYALAMDPAAYEKVSYVVAKFFLERVWVSDNKEINFSYAKGVNPSKRGVNILELQLLDEEYDSKNIKDLKDLIEFLPSVTPRIQNLTMAYFMDSFIKLYKPAATFGLEVLPYFFFIVTSSLIGSFIVRSDVVTNIAKYVHGMNKYYSELVKCVV